MPAFYRIECFPDGSISELAGVRGIYYELADGTHLDIYNTPVWCRMCREVTNGENLGDLAELERDLYDLYDPTSDLYQRTANGLVEKLTKRGTEYLAERIIKTKRRIEWRRNRVSPPKCLRCGSSDIFVFPLDETIPHPTGGGTINVSIAGMCSTVFNEWYFTPEGDRIQRDTKPTYWQHPEINRLKPPSD